MPDNSDLNRFFAVSDFQSLVGYLRDELEWPIEGDHFEDLTFDYSPEELGIDSRFAPKFLSIKRLRPLEIDQPWGIFFIHFETSSLPVVALRRLLSGLVLKGRSRKNIGNRASWHADDLLLISQFEDGVEGNLTFAHFESRPDKLDMPTLRVLGWDAFDTKLKHEHVIKVLKTRLVWPLNPTDQSSWRTSWGSAFELTNQEVIRSSSELAQALAALALKIRYRIRELAAIEHSAGPIHKIMNQLKAGLISDLDIDSFSDIYAQTIAYGLFAARVVEPKSNTADAIGKSLAGLNPLLVDLLSKFAHLAGRRDDTRDSIDFDELGISEVVELLDSLNIEAILRDFGDRNQREDPVMFFFEGFLSRYDNKIKKERGVFYTPRAAVSFIVKSIDTKLRENFGLVDGLADVATWRDMENRGLSIPPQTSPGEFFVQILDPAVGTGTFLVEVIDLVYNTMLDKWRSTGVPNQRLNAYWNDYVTSSLLPRLTGFELMMAPYTIAHLKISLKLVETGYQFSGDQRLQVYLTNTLEPPTNRLLSEQKDSTFVNEDDLVRSVKTNKAFTIIIGNPPYSVSSKNKNSHIDKMMDLYKEAVRSEKNIQPLSDDYVKFIRIAQSYLEFSGAGIIGLITNNAYLTGFIFRGVRKELSKAFPLIELLNLNGNQVIARSSSDRFKDENIFDIQQGICASFFISQNTVEGKKEVRYSSIKGLRVKKSEVLEKETMASVQAQELEVSHPDYLFMPRDHNGLEEYQKGWGIDQIFNENVSGIKTHRDKLVFGFARGELIDRMQLFSSKKENDDYFFSKFDLKETGSWKLSKARESVRQAGDLNSKILPCLYRPFDVRYLFYSDHVIDRSRRALMENMYLIDSNIAILAMRQVAVGDEYTHFGVSDCMIDNRSFFSNRGIVNLFPALIADNNGKVRQNLKPEFISHIERTLGLSVSSRGSGNLSDNFGAINVIHYCHAIFYSTEYKNKFSHLLPFGFPRIPITSSLETFRKLESLGQLLVDLQLLKFTKLIPQHIEFPRSGSNRIEKITVSRPEDDERYCKIFINKTQYFVGPIRSAIDRKYGGYSVCEKWLNERKGACVDDSLTRSFNRLLHALVEMDAVIKRVDHLIVDSGGFDSVFAV